MATTNLNIRTDQAVKQASEQIFSELGLNMTTAINMFLKQAIRTNGIPFELKLDSPNKITRTAIEEGIKLANDSTVQGYSNMDDLKAALEG